MTDVTWLESASALLVGHRCAHVVHVDALRLPSRSSNAASGSTPGTRPPSAIITAVSASTRPRSYTGTTPPRASADDKPAVTRSGQ